MWSVKNKIMLTFSPAALNCDVIQHAPITVARITTPLTMVRLSAGREQMDEAVQALCFAAGANSVSRRTPNRMPHSKQNATLH